jgi:[acyl-carrier-protein] S-malonyltransferase
LLFRIRNPDSPIPAHQYAQVQTSAPVRPYHRGSLFSQDRRLTASTLAFVFPGQGSQSLAMLAELSELHPLVRETFVEASEGAGVDLWALSQQGPEEQLNRTEYTQPALLAAGAAVWRLWQQQGGTMPVALAGHSLGEYTALVAAGMLSLRDAAHLVRIRGQLMQEAAPAGIGAMAAVIGADDELVRTACSEASGSEVVVPANYNSPGQIVIGGHVAAVDRALALLAEKGVRKAVKLAVSVPSHTPLMREAANRLSETMAGLSWHEPQLPIVQNVDAEVHEGLQSVRDALVRQLYLPVQWTAVVEALASRGVTRLGECGPGKVLTGLARRIDKSLDARTLGTPGDFEAALAEWD